MAVRGLGVDEGTGTVKAVQVEKRGGAILPVAAASSSGADAEGSWDSGDLAAALSEAGIKEKAAVAGLTGKDLVIRYHQIPPVPDWQLRKIMDFEIQEIQNQSGDGLAADYNLLPVSSDLSSDDTILLALTREERVDERGELHKAAGLRSRYFSPNALGLYHAFRLYGPATDGDVVVVSVGKSCSDIALLRDGDLLYARSVNTAGDVLTQAIETEFNVSEAKAEKLKRDLGDLRPREKRRGLTPQQEKISHALEGASGRLFQMVQSTLQFAKTQVQLNQLEPTKIFLTGGSSAMKGIDESLSQSLGIPVVTFDPLGESGVEPVGPAGTADYTVALGLAAMAADSEAYSVEVLGAGARKMQEFKKRHVFSVLAVVALLAYIGFLWVKTGEDYTSAKNDAAKLGRALTKRKQNSSKMNDALEERELLSQRLDFLEKKKAGGESMARALRLMSLHVPPELWVSEVTLGHEDRGGVREKAEVALVPEVQVVGKGRAISDRPVDVAYREFVTSLRADLGQVDRLVDSPPNAINDFDFELRFHYLAPPPSTDEDEEEDA